MTVVPPRTVTLEIRRHAERAKEGDAHGALSAAGLAMARALGREDERFALVISSPRERARDTAAAIAGRLDETAAVLDVTSDDVLTQEQYDTLRTQEDVARFLGANASARRFAEAQLASWEATAKRVPDNGRGLVITHGGNIELPAVLLAADLGARLGRLPLRYCEGVRAHYLRGRAAALERLGAVPELRRGPTFVPPLSVLHAFGVHAVPTRLSTGRGRTWATADVVLKPAEDEADAEWVATLAATIEQRGFRLARPIPARDGRWVVDGWTAWTRLPGVHSATRWPELLAAAAGFHEAVRNVPRPEVISRQADANRWRVADRIAWGEASADDLQGVTHLAALLEARRPVDLPAQLIHGDLVGNVLFAEGLPPAIIDLSLYWRPAGYSAALVVGDALAWEGAPPDTVRLIGHFDAWPQLLIRAVIFRIVVNELARRAEPWRAHLSDYYAALVDLSLSFARANR